MSESKFLKGLTKNERDKLKEKLFKQNNGLCFICDKEMDLSAHTLDIDHKVALSIGGLDDENNFALTHAGCNRSKGIRDLQLQRHIELFRNFVKEKIINMPIGENVTVGDVLSDKEGSKSDVLLKNEDGVIKIFFEINKTQIQ